MSEQSLDRFLDAQNSGGMYAQALSELRAGKKQTHWIWYIFPQIRGLGMSDRALRFGIENRNEAKDYLAHPVLGARLHEVAQALLHLDTCDAVEIFGDLDAKKVRSSMTLFHCANPSDPLFRAVLDKFYQGILDPCTLALIEN